MHHVFTGRDGRSYGAHTGARLLREVLHVDDPAPLQTEFQALTTGPWRVQAGSFLFFALGRLLSASTPPPASDDGPAIFESRPECAEARRFERSLLFLPDGEQCDECPTCRTRTVTTLPARQTRSADEPETYLRQCWSCGRRP
jgi:hypothetical protein